MSRLTRFGTCHFVSRDAALKYYATYGQTSADVDGSIRQGNIAIGPPDLKPGFALAGVNEDGRYEIAEVGLKAIESIGCPMGWDRV